MSPPTAFVHSPYLPVDPTIAMYNAAFGHLLPWEFKGWKQETLSWKQGCYLHAGLNPPMPHRLSGPDALKLLEDACINGFAKFSIGASKHAVMCNEFGNVMADGMVWRLGNAEFISFYLGPYLEFLANSGKYDAQVEDLSGQGFLFQVAGPLSLSVLEKASGESLRDIEFLWHRESRIQPADATQTAIPVRIYRLGVARTLAYEVHGAMEHAQAVYQAIMAAGASVGIERLGLQAYGMNHTESGFAQSFIHFLPAWHQDEEFMNVVDDAAKLPLSTLRGSAGPDLNKRVANPVELGWGHMIKLDHAFTGRAAIEAMLANPARKLVTLVWDEADVVAVLQSQFREGEDAEFMDFPANPVWQGNMSVVFADDVFHQNALVGISSGRMFSHYYKKMISLCLIDVDLSAIDTTVDVLWGSPGTHQRRISAKVSRCPFLDLPFNRDIDVRQVP